ncbi:hypothetical protein TSOC_015254 [Tetrabaena socialis]|uniref:Geranylgeranyl transferase type II subunit alpha n=1 Tax=Tetrabaena socialis TaxID=47790 RepID=A0A2J7ZFE4_9CHLO|nr:hypothetical protein TSOC_015254 [Tetrabaena socialis]|eukprot:PNG98975.1 hypothetical protein TSOC_015254 [Tetrabaena socialis]
MREGQGSGNWQALLAAALAADWTGEEELQYVEDKVVQNFSNYSAWHFRTILLHQIHGGGGGGGGAEAGGGGEPGRV